MLEQVIKSLEANNFQVVLANDIGGAKEVFKGIYESILPQSVSYGDSETFFSSHLRSWLELQDTQYIDTFETGISTSEQIKRMREALTVDLFITGSNALTEQGQLVNLDMIGNRVGGINFGPKHVVLFIGTSKIKKNLTEAMDYVRNTVAPNNAKRHDSIRTPCKETGTCMGCKSPTRICNQWLITEKSYPVNRIKIILIKE